MERKNFEKTNLIENEMNEQSEKSASSDDYKYEVLKVDFGEIWCCDQCYLEKCRRLPAKIFGSAFVITLVSMAISLSIIVIAGLFRIGSDGTIEALVRAFHEGSIWVGKGVHRDEWDAIGAVGTLVIAIAVSVIETHYKWNSDSNNVATDLNSETKFRTALATEIGFVIICTTFLGVIVFGILARGGNSGAILQAIAAILLALWLVAVAARAWELNRRPPFFHVSKRDSLRKINSLIDICQNVSMKRNFKILNYSITYKILWIVGWLVIYSMSLILVARLTPLGVTGAPRGYIIVVIAAVVSNITNSIQVRDVIFFQTGFSRIISVGFSAFVSGMIVAVGAIVGMAISLYSETTGSFSAPFAISALSWLVLAFGTSFAYISTSCGMWISTSNFLSKGKLTLFGKAILRLTVSSEKLFCFSQKKKNEYWMNMKQRVSSRYKEDEIWEESEQCSRGGIDVAGNECRSQLVLSNLSEQVDNDKSDTRKQKRNANGCKFLSFRFIKQNM
jgi:MFS family permease